MVTQREIAKKAGVHESLVSLAITGKRTPSWKFAKKLAAATGTDPAWWADGEIEKIISATGLRADERGGKNGEGARIN